MKRHSYRGVIQIVMFNWHQYAAGAAACAIGGWILWRVPLPLVARVPGEIGVGLVTFWLMSSLVVSHYVYDRSGLTAWDWVRALFPTAPERWANIHCGLDETTLVLKQMFPNTKGVVLDIFDEREMTEASIRHARRCATRTLETVHARFDGLPLGDGRMAALFVIFSAHEIRRAQARHAFFHELRRVLAPGGRLVLVEHLRDGWNFLAFGPGCWHFLPRGEWIHCSREAEFLVEREFRKTAFVRVWLFRRKE